MGFVNGKNECNGEGVEPDSLLSQQGVGSLRCTQILAARSDFYAKWPLHCARSNKKSQDRSLGIFRF